ncbi:serine hydrolase [Deinococcus sp. NW-56]|uniref:serine hydrolase domain-containing protein n=1 Tax=Deinococcus sp. NW-56 TaxID=2080419 RepID=UPI000CF51BC5|nr:serine hydrolase domain-containing protein [Deinococcus sp. NW-56]
MPTAQLDALVDEARATNTSALIVMRDGEVVVDEVIDGRGDRPIETMSVTKAVLSLVVGRAVTLGHLPGADVPVCEFFPEWQQGRKRDVTLRHLMTHTSGLQNELHTGKEIYPSSDFVQLALCAELDHDPGTYFAYNNKAANLICGLLERATGQRADDFARAELFGPLGMEEWEWVRDPAGNPHGLAGLRLHARDLARLGHLALDGAGGLISRRWLEESTRPATPAEPSIGLLWWMLPAWTRYSIGEAQIASLRRAGGTPQQVAALERCRCQGVERDRVLHLIGQVGLRPQEFPRDAEWLGTEQGPHVGFRHDGYRGQNLVVHREARLVAVRLIAWDHPQVDAPESAFSAFPDRILALASA